MLWASALSTAKELDEALLEVLGAVSAARSPDLLFVFVSAHHRRGLAAVGPALRDRYPGARVVGCTAAGLVGGGREVERGPALALTAATLPGVQIAIEHVRRVDSMTPPAAGDDPRGLVVLADPFTCDAQALVCALDDAWPGCPQVGGIASGGQAPGETALLLDDTVLGGGAVVVKLSGALTLDTLVAQGCRPVGEPMFVTHAEGQMLYTLDGVPALKALEGLVRGLPKDDRELAKRALCIGVVMDPARQRYGRGDFLVRNLVGADPERGAIAVGALLEPQQVVQFHVRDAQTSADDLDALLGEYAPTGAPRGALLFSCLGRGEGLYGAPDHDSKALQRHLGPVPLGGFFCNGEIGPVQGRTWLHGYTSAFGLFRESSS